MGKRLSKAAVDSRETGFARVERGVHFVGVVYMIYVLELVKRGSLENEAIRLADNRRVSYDRHYWYWFFCVSCLCKRQRVLWKSARQIP